jgi:hypothetical protein
LPCFSLEKYIKLIIYKIIYYNHIIGGPELLFRTRKIGGMEMIKSKKGDGLSMNVIIIAILALLVLVVLTLIFIQQMDKASTQTNAICLTQAIGAKCVDTAVGCPTGLAPSTKGPFTDCSSVNAKTCCVPPTS